MLTMNARFKMNDEIQSIAVHIFEQVKNPYSSWKTGRDFIFNLLKEMGLFPERVVKVS